MIDADGWLHTNDAARMDDDGYFQVFGPLQELWRDEAQALILPRDIEEVIIELPEVKETAVIACQNQPVAFVCLHPKVQLASEAILDYCRERLPANHQPRQVVFIDKLPRSPIGKVLKRELIRRCGIMDTSLDE
jgi:long-chain acyl-CoA synthetase